MIALRRIGIVLAIGSLLGASGCAPRHSTSSAATTAGTRAVTLEVGGMVCADCVAKVHDQLARVPGVRSVTVSLEDQRARIVCDPAVADTSLTRAVRRAGPDYIGLVVAR